MSKLIGGVGFGLFFIFGSALESQGKAGTIAAILTVVGIALLFIFQMLERRESVEEIPNSGNVKAGGIEVGTGRIVSVGVSGLSANQRTHVKAGQAV